MAVSAFGEAIRRLCGDASGRVRKGERRRIRGDRLLQSDPLRGHACGARRIAPAVSSRLIRSRVGPVGRDFEARHKGHRACKFHTGPHPFGLRLSIWERRKNGGDRAPFAMRIYRRDPVCGDERLSARARPRRPRDGAENARRARRSRGVSGRGQRAHGSELRLSDRGSRNGIGTSVSLCDARKKDLFRHGRACDFDVARLFALSAARHLRTFPGQKKVRRKGNGPACGVWVIPTGSRGDREIFLSGRGDRRVGAVSRLCSSRAIFQEAPRENTSRQPKCRGWRSRS